MKKIIASVISVFIVILLVSDFVTCQDEKKVVRKAIKEAIAKHVAAHKRQDAVGAAAAAYTDDAWIIGEGGQEFKGRSELEATYAQTYKFGVVVKEFEYTTEELTVRDDIAVQIFRYQMTTAYQGQEKIRKYKAMAVWQRQQDGSWKIHRVIFISAKASE